MLATIAAAATATGNATRAIAPARAERAPGAADAANPSAAQVVANAAIATTSFKLDSRTNENVSTGSATSIARSPRTGRFGTAADNITHAAEASIAIEVASSGQIVATGSRPSSVSITPSRLAPPSG